MSSLLINPNASIEGRGWEWTGYCQMTTVLLSSRRCLRGNSIFQGNYDAQWPMPTRYISYQQVLPNECLLNKS